MPGGPAKASKADAIPTTAAQVEAAAESTPLIQGGPLKQAGSHALSRRLKGGIFITHHMLKGFVAGGGDEGLIGKPVEFLFGAMHVPAQRMQSLVVLGAFSPWVLKPLVGALCDTVPIHGYRKNPYIVLMTVLACVAVGALGSGFASTSTMITWSLFLASLQVAGCTLLVDAKRSEVAKAHSELGPELVSFTEVGMNLGIVGSALFVGPLIKWWGPRAPYVVAAPLRRFAAPARAEQQPARRAASYWRPGAKPPHAPQEPVALRLGPIHATPSADARLGIGHRPLGGVARGATLLLVVGGYGMLIRPEISGPVVFYFVFRCLNLHLNGAYFYFFTDAVDFFPQGPNFSPFFYATVMTSVATAGRIVGYMTAKSLFADWHYSRVLYAAMPLAALTQLSMLPLILRWNTKVGVPDEAWVLVCTFVDMVARGWRHYPFSVILLQATPRGLEASSLALNTGVANMGTTLSAFFGSCVLAALQVHADGHEGDVHAFDQLWKAQLLAALLPMSVLLLMPLLMPWRRQNEALIQKRSDPRRMAPPWSSASRHDDGAPLDAAATAMAATERGAHPKAFGVRDAWRPRGAVHRAMTTVLLLMPLLLPWRRQNEALI
eukprot:CAMPEP_0117500590 /NCGR_PEP_ID=MMETSP0784-20121206/22853_1 /TAXON_ID=39447 /ORGANISM="" /LENGTH=606 /DNA_ID=CAMNT_0005295801 /DNA_START=101 /DNA_END=1918 /DNA_ORIENTATION=+